MIKHRPSNRRWAVCVDNAEFPASLERGKLYRVLTDRVAATEGFVRVVDESGDDYLYPSQMFEPIRLSDKIRRALTTARRHSRRRPGTVPA